MADEIKTESVNGGMDCDENLPEVVASMKKLSVDAKGAKGSNSTRYSLRTRVAAMPTPAPTSPLNRRCNSRPKKRSYSTSETDAQRKAYYLDKSTKNLPNKTLETIYEEFDDMNVTTTLMSSRKFRRFIDFKNKTAAPAKLNKRTLKIKRIFGSKSHLQSKQSKVSMQALVKKLDSILARPPSAES
ncbi:uncharacterized protein LOC130665734 [Microplitis mediator]|uniref:uncharacterized protein LOC130665734 n=1 Tax=Microplitis mediator TaxID=375433 RepID=UPI002552D858|nr:uncharacterized protein LOC130665734 [Microplitis mediator]